MINEIIEKARKENKKVYIYAHKFPDGDAINSACAIVEYLKKQGINAQYIVTNDSRIFSQVVGQILPTKEITKGEISLILDTSTIEYAENKMFKYSSVEDIYVIDHHGKTDNTKTIEDELGLPSKNVIRNSEYSSTSEILINEFEKEKITLSIANMLFLGLLSDTGRLKHLKNNTLQNVSKLISLGVNFEKIIAQAARKSRLSEEVGLSKVLLKAKRFPIGKLFGIVLPIDNNLVNIINKKYRIRNVQKKIFKFTDIENCGFACMFAENFPGEYNLEFRSNSIYGNFDVLSLASKYNGGGHYNASGCTFKKQDGYNKDLITIKIINEAQQYSTKINEKENITITELDKQLEQILNYTKKLTTNVTPEILEQIDYLVKQGANYNYAYSNFKSFEKLMLEQEILSKISDYYLYNKDQKIEIYLSQQEIEMLKQKYNITEKDILDVIEIFVNIDIDELSINLENGYKAYINKDGYIKKTPIINDFYELINILKELNTGIDIEIVSSHEINCSVMPNELFLPLGFYFTEENVLTNQYNSQDKFLSIKVNSLLPELDETQYKNL